ncbi:FAD-binding protein [Aureispira anguillae]|uniref:FAD-binding protein n=1 Tax=Aureispira anguillae TaxID=2864201 RepID=A0A916DQA6_9BACT|nr:FAD-binding protein [Aureispira anguillae]BDS09985.1 FAD-binding protein [Aureispira anguillae]
MKPKKIQQKLPVSYLMFTYWGRINRLTYWHATLFIWLAFYVLYNLIEYVFGTAATIVLYPFLFWTLLATASKRLHDVGKSAYAIGWIVVPIVGPLWLVYQLGFRKGTVATNSYGNNPRFADDYLQVTDEKEIHHLKTKERIINDVTTLNPIIVAQVKVPKTIQEVQQIIQQTTGTISIGGGRFSMGGQTASTQSTHLDMRQLNQVVAFSKEHKTITIQSGARWCDLQAYVDAHDLSVMIMQTYANFTVGGSVSVNVHGRYMGLGPIILSILSVDVVLADGRLVHASRTEQADLFFGIVGGYGGLGVLVQVEFSLADNIPVKRIHQKMDRSEYWAFFDKQIRFNQEAVFHNADMYLPSIQKINAVTWVKTDEQPNVKHRLMPLKASYPLERYFFWMTSESPFGKWRREHIIEPLFYRNKRIHWRNYEAGYDVAELEPKSRKNKTYVLLEYFVPVAKFDAFSVTMNEIFLRHNVNVINISIRHAIPDTGAYLAWAREEVFAFVVYYKQGTSPAAKGGVAVWNRELVDAVIAVGGTYYLPYQAHATKEQFLKAYPNAPQLFALKTQLDPDFRFRNVIWDHYYQPKKEPTMPTNSEFQQVFSDTKQRDAFFHFLQVVYNLYPEEKFHHLIVEACKEETSDQAIYKWVQSRLPSIKPFLADLRYGLPALKKQKQEMSRQTLELLDGQKTIDGYIEIGAPARYVSDLRKHINLKGDCYIIHDSEPDYSIPSMLERGQIRKLGKYIPLDYKPIDPAVVANESIDVVTCFIGLHHCPIDQLVPFVQSIHRVLRKGGKFILRDHDAGNEQMATFCSLVHTVFNLGLNESWEFDQAEFRNFKSIEEWCSFISSVGFRDAGKRILQHKDPSDNTLVSLIKE